MPDATEIAQVFRILRQRYPSLLMHDTHGHDPFQMLVAVILSQRARDSVTVPLATTLFAVAPTPEALDRLSQTELEQIIRPIGFYRAKARALKSLARVLLSRHGGTVPSTEEELLHLPQVGRKTANIILTTFFATPQIAVDIHVHRITNRLGWIQTTQVEETEKALTSLIPKSTIPIVNQVFVAHGQTICLPRNPHCNQCPIQRYCQKIGIQEKRLRESSRQASR